MLATVGRWVWVQFMTLKPSFISKNPHFNFISVHYFFILSMVILGSVLIYGGGRGNITYIDSLFFGSTSSTQAGLNVVNVNSLNTFQQIIMYIWPMLTGPITMHGSVVLLRLYWFEKRFQNVARDARSRRVSISKSRSKYKSDLSRAERGVGGRVITVLRDTGNHITNDGMIITPKPAAANSAAADRAHAPGAVANSSSSSASETTKPGDDKDRCSSESGGTSASAGNATGNATSAPGLQHQATISFAPMVTRSDGAVAQPTKLSHGNDDENHMPALERQMNTRDTEILRIPNPMDVERGLGPKRLEEGDNTADCDDVDPTSNADGSNQTAGNSADELRRRNQSIAFQEPNWKKNHDRGREQKPEQGQENENENEDEQDRNDGLVNKARALAHAFGALKFRKPRFLQPEDESRSSRDSDDSSHVRPVRSKTFERVRTALSGRDKDNVMPYLSWDPSTGRNSNFPNLSMEQREELGGIEYRSLRTLALLLFCYFWGFQLFGLACMLPYIHTKDKYGAVVDAAGMSRTWWAFFTSNSLFMDVGLSLTPDSMYSFATSAFVLMIGSFLIIIGNTGFPVMLRVIIWILSRLVPRGSGLWEELMFLLDHPRRCFTLLFPSSATWWLFLVLFLLNAVDVISFVVLDLNNPVVEDLPWNLRVVNGIFQASSTRTAGFTSLPLNLIHPAVQTLTMIMMYISVYPIAISIRASNVYEEKSLGLYSKVMDVDMRPSGGGTASYIGTHLRRQLSFDLWFVFLGLFILAITEGTKLQEKKFNMFDVLFETVSAYGTVGMSMGYPGVDPSLSGSFSTGGKLVIIAMMIRGRHRGLPYGLDRAILLPSDPKLPSDAELAPAAPASDGTMADAATGMSADSASGMTRTATRRMSNATRPRTVERPSTNIFSQLLYPGPTLPPKIHRTRTVATLDLEDDDDDDDDMRPVERARTYAG